MGKHIFTLATLLMLVQAKERRSLSASYANPGSCPVNDGTASSTNCSGGDDTTCDNMGYPARICTPVTGCPTGITSICLSCGKMAKNGILWEAKCPSHGDRRLLSASYANP